MSTATATVTPQELVKGVVKLVSLPEVCLRVSEMVDNPRCSARDIGKVMARDTALTARLLKIVNSPFYGMTVKIETVSRAITVVGMRELRDLIMATSAVRAFDNIPNDLIDMTAFWRHAVYCGVVARLLASKCNVLHSERLFVAGLLHDIGKLLIFHKLPEQAREVLSLARGNGGLAFHLEQEVYGFDHAEVGGALMHEWNMPESLQESVGCHHQPGRAEQFVLEATIVHVADVLTHAAEDNADLAERMREFDPAALETLKMEPAGLEELLRNAGPQFGEALNLVLPAAH